jgi:glycosyltransferase involved in cell wall biosynthesis
MARILVLSNMYPPHHYGGYELSCRDVMDRFAARGHEVTVLTTTMRVPGVADPAAERDLGIRRDLDFYWRDHVLTSPPLWRRAATERRNHAALDRALRDVDPDVVSIWNMGAMSLGLLAALVERDVPLVYNVCDDWLDYGPHLDAWARMFRRRPRLGALASTMARVPARVPDLGSTGTFCFVSERTRRHAIERTGWTFPRSTVVYSGIEPDDFPVAAPTDHAWSWRLLFVGRIDDRKGIGVVVRALALLPEQATVEVVGAGDEGHRRRLEALARELGVADRVRFDVCERSALRHRYAAADVFVFPSTWDEPFGLVPVEAMACGTPVIATGRGGSAEFLVDGGNALLVPAGDHVALASAVRRLAADPSLRSALARRGFDTAAELTTDRLADVLEEWHLAAAARFRAGEPPHRRLPAHLTGPGS